MWWYRVGMKWLGLGAGSLKGTGKDND